KLRRLQWLVHVHDGEQRSPKRGALETRRVVVDRRAARDRALGAGCARRPRCSPRMARRSMPPAVEPASCRCSGVLEGQRDREAATEVAEQIGDGIAGGLVFAGLVVLLLDVGDLVLRRLVAETR